MPKLTKRLINETKAERELVLWDDSLPSFGVRVKPTGVKTFVVQYRNKAGRSRRLSIGKLGRLTLDEARKEALRLLSKTSLGEDPLEERQTLRKSETVAGLWARYMAEYCEGRSKPSTMAAHRWLYGRHIGPLLGTRRLVELTRIDVGRMHLGLKNTPYNANRALGLLRAMLNWAERQEIIPIRSNSAMLVKPYPERKRERFLSEEELARLLGTIEASERDGEIDIYVGAAIRLLIYTGCRVGEIITLPWSGVDFERSRLVIERHKTDQFGAKIIPLNAPALEVLCALRRMPGNPHVIVGRVEGAHLINLEKPWRRVRNRAGLDDLRLHDLRHSFASFAAGAGVSLPIIGGLLGHKSLQATARYAHLAQGPLRAASNLIAVALVPPVLQNAATAANAEIATSNKAGLLPTAETNDDDISYVRLRLPAR